MVPIYEALQFVSVIQEQSGHTKPWVVLVNTPAGLKPYVVKLYDTTQVDEQHRVCKEIISNLLASEFDLKVPQCALIEIPPDFVISQTTEVQQQLDNADPRLKFATEYIEGAPNSLIEMDKKIVENKIDLDTLYAFDNLIRNHDRGQAKPNLLLGSEYAYLIDHEYAFTEKDIIGIDFNSLQLISKFTKTHLFYHYLKNSRDKQNFFEDFSFYLESLSLNKFNIYFDQLKNNGFNDYSEPILDWLNLVKQKKTIFVNYLKGSLLP